MDDHTLDHGAEDLRRVYVSVWQAHDRVAVIAVNDTLPGAVGEAQKYGDRLNAENAAYRLHRTHPEAGHHLARWSDHDGTHQIFITSKVVKP